MVSGWHSVIAIRILVEGGRKMLSYKKTKDLTRTENFDEEIVFVKNIDKREVDMAKEKAGKITKRNIEELYTIAELKEKYIRTACELFQPDVWQAYKEFIDFDLMIRCDIAGGYLDYCWIEINGNMMPIFFYTI